MLCHGQVLPAPGSPPQSRMVASKTQKPHFVSFASDGRFECDETCEGFKQRYICAHSVAAAEDNRMLKSFIESYAQFSKTPKGHRSTTPNFTRLSMSNLPRRTAGQKGGKPPKKKAICRRNTISSEHRQPLLSNASTDRDKGDTGSGVAASSSSGSEYSFPISSPNSSSSLTVITSSGNWNWNWDSIPSSSMGYYPPPPYPGAMFYPPYPGYSTYGSAPLADITNYSPYAQSPYLPTLVMKFPWQKTKFPWISLVFP